MWSEPCLLRLRSAGHVLQVRGVMSYISHLRRSFPPHPIGVLFGCFGRTIDDDSWFPWWVNHLPGKPIYFHKRTPMASRHFSHLASKHLPPHRGDEAPTGSRRRCCRGGWRSLGDMFRLSERGRGGGAGEGNEPHIGQTRGFQNFGVPQNLIFVWFPFGSLLKITPPPGAPNGVKMETLGGLRLRSGFLLWFPIKTTPPGGYRMVLRRFNQDKLAEAVSKKQAETLQWC